MPHSTTLDEVLIILLAAVAVVPLFQRLRSSPVLGYLVAGMLIGPHGLGVVGNLESATFLAHFGVVFLLFAIGLELSVERLRVMRRTVFGLGTLQVVVTMAGAWAVGRLFGLSSPAALIAAGGVALSSTAVVLQILIERNELTARHGRVSFAVLLLQDLAVVPLLVLVPLLGTYEANIATAMGLAAVKAVVALVGIMVLGRKVLSPLLRTVASARSPELFTGVTLLIVLGVGWLTERAGLSMALGAFLAGLVIAETEFRHQVEADIEPFRGILLALFFMTVGMTIDLRLILNEAVSVAGLLALVVVGKALVLAVLCRAFGQAPGQSLQVALGLAQGGEFAFVLFDQAAGLDVLPREVAQLLMVVIALSMAATPFLAAAGRRLAHQMTAAPQAELQRIEGETADLDQHVLIAGFGRVGQTLGRLLEANRIPYVALDLEPKRVSEGRQRNLPVYFGDAARPDVLKAAGGARARAAVVTLDHPQAAERAVRSLRRLRPDMPIIVRARDGSHRETLEKAGATMVVPEAVEASLQLGGTLLRGIGKPADEVSYVLDLFRDEAYARLGGMIPARPQRTAGPPPISLDDLNDPRR
ncbi:monovalent cation:proton antiporter-2 (CPA2) family protein [Azospirillum soli]|uniref:monovalent cation:proton antiporter-2 (CPA2) family protein n=1 Tax=Azospirillum soli TaxID=1304799 RepID=UPI001AE111C3|nr:monovalent cation:proton antiporter-2 (CPA2) family protein [Azospirillum soli]MBP2312446.1 CPA2 family monovalent cation:H+ antiporter-2 [Azospirillum soli]